MDYVTINAATASARAAATILQAILKLKLDHETLVKITEALQKVADVQQQLFSATEQLFRLQQERDELQRQIAADEAWEKDTANYCGVSTPGGAFVYKSLKAPDHYICPACFSEKQIIPLQGNGTSLYECPKPKCKATYQIGVEPETVIYSNRDTGPWE